MYFPLFQQLADPQSLYDAWRSVWRKNGAPGCDGKRIQDFYRDEKNNILKISSALRQGIYDPLPFRAHFIPKTSPGKWRRISIPAVRDRIVQQCTNSILQRNFDRLFAPCSYAYRPGRSIRDAIAAVRNGLNAGFLWAVRGDIRGCFDEIDRDVLSVLLKKIISDAPFLSVLNKTIRAPVISKGFLQNPARGIPQGSPVSPFLSNLYLHQLDCALLSKGHFLIRFADDWVILARDYRSSCDALKTAINTLTLLNIGLNREKSGIFDLGKNSIEFLGHTISRNAIQADGKGWRRAISSAESLHSAQNREEYLRARGSLLGIQAMYRNTGPL